MTIMFEPATAGMSRGWTLLFAGWRQLTATPAINAEDRRTARAIRTLSGMDERELNDIGLSRSDLTPEGLAEAGARRSREQASIAAEIATGR